MYFCFCVRNGGARNGLIWSGLERTDRVRRVDTMTRKWTKWAKRSGRQSGRHVRSEVVGSGRHSGRHYIIINFKFQSKSIVSMFLRIHFEEGINSFPQIVAHLEFVTQFDCNFLAVHFSSWTEDQVVLVNLNEKISILHDCAAHSHIQFYLLFRWFWFNGRCRTNVLWCTNVSY